MLSTWAPKLLEMPVCENQDRPNTQCSLHRTVLILWHEASVDLPQISHQRYVKPLFSRVSTQRMRGVLQHLSSFYTRYFGSADGEQSAQWLHRQLAEVCVPSPRGRLDRLVLTRLPYH
jgi:hypothetical protein